MVVRVRLALKALKGSRLGDKLETSALVNSVMKQINQSY
jgi:hypothetical protein